MRVAATILLGILFAGCARPDALVGPPPAHACFQSFADAEWKDPDLYDALAPAAARSGLTLAPLNLYGEPAGALLPRWRDPRIVGLQRDVEDTGTQMRLHAHAAGEWMLQSSVTWENETLARYAGDFLDAVGLVEHPERAAWLRALNASRQHGPYPVAYLVANPDLARVLAALGDAPRTTGSFSHVAMETPPWTVHLEVGRLHLPTTSAGARFDLFVDETGSARASTEIAPADDAASTLASRTQDVFGRLGLPAPAFSTVRGGAC